MLIPITKIQVRDRIRKDFGDIEELAKDIEQNGLINPPVVNKEYTLLAGERRLRACRMLGWEQIPVTMMDTRDAEHELNIEISENDCRKDFSKAERVDYMYRLMRIEKEKARERQAKTQFGSNAVQQKFAEPDKGQARDKTAAAFGVSGETMRKEMQIVENKDLLTPEDFADWDEGRLSTNKAFQRVKAELERVKQEKAGASEALAALDKQVRETAEENRKLRADNRVLANRVKPDTIYLAPDDYEQMKEDLEKAEVNLYSMAIDDMELFVRKYEKVAEIAPVIAAMKEAMT